MVGANGIRAGKGLRSSSSAHRVAIKLAVGKIAGAIRGESANGAKRGRDGSVSALPSERKCIIAIQRGVVYAGLATNCGYKKQCENQGQHSIALAHLSSTTSWATGTFVFL